MLDRPWLKQGQDTVDMADTVAMAADTVAMADTAAIVVTVVTAADTAVIVVTVDTTVIMVPVAALMAGEAVSVLAMETLALAIILDQITVLLVAMAPTTAMDTRIYPIIEVQS